MSHYKRCRTYLAVPGNRSSMVAKAAASDADAVFIDLEDAVPPVEKLLALQGAIDAISKLNWGAKLLGVRVNSADSGMQIVELSALCGLQRLDAIIVPKAEVVSDIMLVSQTVRDAQGERPTPVELELLIETARGMMNVDALAGCDPLVAGLHLGVGDFAASIGARSAEIGASPAAYRHVGTQDGRDTEVPLDLFAYPMMRVLVAARAFGLRAIDGPCGDYSNQSLTAASAAKAAAMGFDGKQVIHPAQIALTREGFTPTDAEIAYARKVEAAMNDARDAGLGAISFDGKMIDEANLRLIRRILEFA